MPWAPVAWAWRGSASSMARTRSVMPSIAAAQISIGAPAPRRNCATPSAPVCAAAPSGVSPHRAVPPRLPPAEEQLVPPPPLQPVETLDRLIEHGLILDRQMERHVRPMADAAVVERKLLLVLARIQRDRPHRLAHLQEFAEAPLLNVQLNGQILQAGEPALLAEGAAHRLLDSPVQAPQPARLADRVPVVPPGVGGLAPHEMGGVRLELRPARWIKEFQRREQADVSDLPQVVHRDTSVVEVQEGALDQWGVSANDALAQRRVTRVSVLRRQRVRVIRGVRGRKPDGPITPSLMCGHLPQSRSDERCQPFIHARPAGGVDASPGPPRFPRAPSSGGVEPVPGARSAR